MQAQGGDGRPTVEGNSPQVFLHFVNSGPETKVLSLRAHKALLSQKALPLQIDKDVQAWIWDMGYPTLDPETRRSGIPLDARGLTADQLWQPLPASGLGSTPTPELAWGRGGRSTLRIQPPTGSEEGN